MLKEFRLPDAGEGLTEADIVTWRVRPGDRVAVNDVIVEIETAKSLVELPCPFAGVVAELLVPEGATAPVGAPIISIDTGSAGDVGGSADPAHADGATAGPDTPERTPVLVGYGPRVESPPRRRRRRAVVGQPAEPPLTDPPPGSSDAPPTRPLAKPPVRKLAKDLGVDLATVLPSGPEGVITRADVQAAAAGPGVARGGAELRPPGPTGERETRTPVRGVRRLTAEAMLASAFTAPHVTEWVEADVTRSVRLVERLRSDASFEGVRLSPLALVAKALLVAVARNPQVNATFDAGAGEHGEIVTKHYVNLGIAAATPRGLVVPVIRDADRLGLRGLAEAITDLAETARAGRTAPSELSGGTITITNVGVFGVDGGTPILNPGESAILAVGRIARKPWVHRGKVRPRWVTTLALSFDHRVVDGELGSRVLTDVAAVLTDPATALT